MKDLDIAYIVSVAKHRLLLMLLTTLLAFSVAATVVSFLPPSYVASAKILVEAPQIPANLARSTVLTSPVEQLQILQQQITARDSLVALARRLDIYADSQGKPEPEGLAENEDIVHNMISRIRFDQTTLDMTDRDQGATVYAISFIAKEPVMAANVANELAAMVLDQNQRLRTDRAGSTLQFFDQEVARLDEQLRQIEADILNFKNANKDTLPENLEFSRKLLSSLQETLVSREREGAELRSRRSTLLIGYAGNGQYPSAVPLTPQQQALSELNRAVSEQLAIFREDSPNIRALRARIASVQKDILAEHENSQEAGLGNAKQPASGLDLLLSDIDDRQRAIAREKETTEQRIEDLNGSIARTPAAETRLNSLLRNRENIQTQYNAAIARRAEASTGEQIEMRSDGGRVTLLESALPPTKPVNSKRRIIVALAGLFGLGVGLGITVLLEMLNRTVRRPQDVARLLQAQALGTIPVLMRPGEDEPKDLPSRILGFAKSGMTSASTPLRRFRKPIKLAVVNSRTSVGAEWPAHDTTKGTANDSLWN